MSILRLNGTEFRLLAGQILGDSDRMRFQASGTSMHPFIQDGDILQIAPLAGKRIQLGDVLLLDSGERRLLAHRVVKVRRQDDISMYLIKGDSTCTPDGWFGRENILGYLEMIERGRQRISLTSAAQRVRAWMWVMLSPWAAKFSWLPTSLRQLVGHWLLGD